MIILRLTNEQAEYLQKKMEAVLSDYHWTSKVREEEVMLARAIKQKIKEEWLSEEW